MIRRIVVLSLALGAVALLPAAAQASTQSISLNGCTLHSYAPWWSGSYAYGRGEITCSYNHFLKIEVCVQAWGSSGVGYCNTSSTYWTSDLLRSSKAFVPQLGSWRTWTWGDVNGVTATLWSSWSNL